MKSPKNFVKPDKSNRAESGQDSLANKDNTDISETGNLNEEDFEALGPEDLSMDMGEDEQLKHRTHPVDFSGEDLDVPGAELDDFSEELGTEDEENNSYSLDDND